MVNIRPIQTEKVPWPWKNAITDEGHIVTVEHHALSDADFPTTLLPYFDWARYEIKDRADMGKHPRLCTCDMRSILTTARRAYGDERLYNLLLNGKDPFKKIFMLFAEWAITLLATGLPIYGFVIGDDLAHKDNLFYPLEFTYMVLRYQWELATLAKEYNANFIVFHSDGKLHSSITPHLNKFNRVVIQADLNPDLKLKTHILDHTKGAIFDRVSYGVKEDDIVRD